MGKGYKRLDALERLLTKRAEKQRMSPADMCAKIISECYSVDEKDLREEIPGQLDLQDKE